tara:strand:+ start:775 stop:1020 length:246 start_codon:yes stop_codon:yes gene_type:complete
MEYFFGPALALLISLKFTSMQKDEQRLKMQDLDERIELIEEALLTSQATNEKRDEEFSKKVLATIMPVAKAVNKLNQTVGI